MDTLRSFFTSRLRFDRNELSGAFGDIGTVFPLIIGIIAVTGMDGARVFIGFGLMQIMTALVYGIPMPVQPLKAASLIVITQKLPGSVLTGGGFAIGIVMLILTMTGLVDILGRYIPKAVVRGVQMGLGLQLAMLALRKYIPSGGMAGYWLAAAAFAVIIALMGNRRFPPALIVIAIGIVYAAVFIYQPGMLLVSQTPAAGLSFPGIGDMINGFLLLAIPQIPLSLGNSIYATGQMVKDFFPEKYISTRKVSFTYSMMNIISPVLGGIPVCHGSGGMAGHFTFGARTGGSVIICGLMFLAAGLIFGHRGTQLISLFPLPLLGVVLFFEALALLNLITDMAAERNNFIITLIVGICCISLPYGYIAGIAAGTAAHYAFHRRSIGLPGTLPVDV